MHSSFYFRNNSTVLAAYSVSVSVLIVKRDLSNSNSSFVEVVVVVIVETVTAAMQKEKDERLFVACKQTLTSNFMFSGKCYLLFRDCDFMYNTVQ